MRFNLDRHKYGLTLWVLVLVFPSVLLMAQPQQAVSNVQVWDTMVPLGNPVDIRDRGKWQAVPTDLLLLEAKPATAESDPAYYGRDYTFRGDAVMETRQLLAVFPTGSGTVIVYSKADRQTKVELVPLELKGKSSGTTHCSILQNTGDEATFDVSFMDGTDRSSMNTLHAAVSLTHTGMVTIKPAGSMKGVSLGSPMEYGVVPSFIGDDLVFDPGQYPDLDTLCMPAEHLLLGLLKDENSMLVVTWPDGKQSVTLSLDKKTQMPGLIESMDIETDGKSLYMSLLEAPGIWHKEELKRSYLEKDITTNWKRPFRAKWKTLLLESKTQTTFVFKEGKQDIWRGAVGSYTYPVWFDGDQAMYRLGKKIPPKGESIVYFTERQGTPLSVSAPVDILEASLGRDLCDAILDIPGRQLRTHHRRRAGGIRRACTCGCTEAIQAVFRANEEVTRKQYVAGAVEDMMYFVRRHVARIGEYQAFARDVMAFLELEGKSAGPSKAYIESMMEIVRELQEEYNRARENMKTLAYADQLARQTNALTQRKASGNLDAWLELGKQWRAMGGAQDDVVAQSHRMTRKLFSQAGYESVDNPGSVAIAMQIRAKCRQCLRNPDGYEIWPNY